MDFFANVFNNNNRRSRNSDRNQRGGGGGNEQQRRSTPRPSSNNTGSSSSRNTNTNQGRSQPRPAGGNMFHGLGGLGGHGMDDFLSAAMASMTGHAGGPPTQQQEGTPPPGQGGAPPASAKAIRQLPRVLVSSEDLVDENNRECCICFEEHKIGDKVTRLPCAHIFHTECITEWLNKHCTCPICRYELPTDDANFEKGRKVRMASRKPRYAKYELERLSGKELRDLCKRLNMSNVNDLFMGSEKSEVIQAILESGKIDVIVAPEPVEYDNVQTLRNMGVGKLKKAMAEAGVFFDAKDVVEKEDMVKIFLNSGRIVLLEPISDVDEGGISDSGYEHIVVEDPYPTYKFSEDDEIENFESERRRSSSDDDLNNEPTYKFSEDDEIETSESKRGSSDDLSNENPSNPSDESESKRARMAPSTNTTTTSTNSDNNNVYDNDDTPVYQASSFARTSIKSLRELADELEVDISDCIEKREMIDRIVDAISRRPGRPR